MGKQYFEAISKGVKPVKKLKNMALSKKAIKKLNQQIDKDNQEIDAYNLEHPDNKIANAEKYDPDKMYFSKEKENTLIKALNDYTTINEFCQYLYGDYKLYQNLNDNMKKNCDKISVANEDQCKLYKEFYSDEPLNQDCTPFDESTQKNYKDSLDHTSQIYTNQFCCIMMGCVDASKVTASGK